ncbi:MAG: hypothetical protein ACK4FF_03665 [Limnobacter sp.]
MTDPRHQTRLLPGWAKLALLAMALLAAAAYLSPDMRAVFVAAWAACL